MPTQNFFISYLLEMLEDFGSLRAKAMFGGFGIYRGDAFFAVIVDDTLYIKADDKNRIKTILQPHWNRAISALKPRRYI